MAQNFEIAYLMPVSFLGKWRLNIFKLILCNILIVPNAFVGRYCTKINQGQKQTTFLYG